MRAFQLLLAVLLGGLTIYTMPVMLREGSNLFPAFFGDIAEHRWPGQFNVDFTTFLVLSAVWTAWRKAFSVTGVLLGAVAFFFGGIFLCSYLLYLTVKHANDPAAILLGANRSRAAS